MYWMCEFAELISAAAGQCHGGWLHKDSRDTTDGCPNTGHSRDDHLLQLCDGVGSGL